MFGQLNPSPIVSESFEQQLGISLKQQQHFSSLEDLHKWALFNLGNTQKGPDGRTYVFINSDGQYVSRFVSQFSDLINDNIEPKIHAVIEALHKKGYLTFGSCQGHPGEIDWRRWFGVCFASAESREQFIQNLKSFQLPLTYWKDIATPSKKEGSGLRLKLTYRQKNNDEGSHTPEEITKYWNIMFCRNYTQYYPLAVGICSDLSGQKRILNFLRFFAAQRHIDKFTKKLATNLIDLPEYIDI